MLQIYWVKVDFFSQDKGELEKGINKKSLTEIGDCWMFVLDNRLCTEHEPLAAPAQKPNAETAKNAEKNRVSRKPPRFTRLLGTNKTCCIAPNK